MYFILFGMITGFIFAIIGYQKNLLTSRTMLSGSSSTVSHSVIAVIAAKNEEEVLEKTVRNLLNKAPDTFRLIVVDDGSTDSTPLILEKLKGEFSNLLVMKNKGLPGKPDSLNTALKVVKEDIVLFIDADALVDWNFVNQYRKMFFKTDTDVIFADFQPYNLKRTLPVIFQDIFFAFSKTYVFSGLLSKPAFMNSGVFVKREVFDHVGKFDPCTMVDDFNLILKLWKENRGIKYVIAYPCMIQYSSTFKDLFKQYSRWQTGVIKELLENIKKRNKTALGVLITGGVIIYSPFLLFFLSFVPGMGFMRTIVFPFILGFIYCAGIFAYICQERRKTFEIVLNVLLGLPVIVTGYQVTLLVSFFKAFKKSQSWYKVKREDLRELEHNA